MVKCYLGCLEVTLIYPKGPFLSRNGPNVRFSGLAAKTSTDTSRSNGGSIHNHCPHDCRSERIACRRENSFHKQPIKNDE